MRKIFLARIQYLDIGDESLDSGDDLGGAGLAYGCDTHGEGAVGLAM